jgi:glycosyltransferase involved in cell wall biosynthesis
MKILHVTDGSIYNYDGVSTYINELLEVAGKGGAKLLVLTTVPLNPEKLRQVIHDAEVKEFKRLRVFSTLKFNFSLPHGMKKALYEFDPDLIWIHTIGPLGLKAAVLAKNKYHTVYTKHCFYGDLWCNHLHIPSYFQWIFHLVARAAERKILKASDVVLFHNNNYEMTGINGIGKRFRYVPPPLSEKFLNPESHSRKKQNEILTIGFCGRLDPEKSLELLFKAARIYQRKHSLNDIRILLIGDGSEAERLMGQYPDVSTTVTGFIDDVIPYLDMLDAFVLSSSTETSSLSSLEAYSRGIPVFSTPVGYLGQNPDKFPQIFNFNTADELSSLIYEVLVLRKDSEYSYPENLGQSVISFSKLHELATSRSL